MLLDRLDTTNKNRVYDFLYNSKYSNLLQLPNWTIVKDNWDSSYIYVERDNKIVGAEQILSRIDCHTGHKLFYIPHGPVCDPEDLDTFKSLINEAILFARSEGAFLLKVEPRIEFDPKLFKKYSENILPVKIDAQFFGQAPMSTILNFNNRSLAEIFSDYSKNMRNNIRSSYKKNLKLYVGTRADLPIFYEMLKQMSINKGIGVRPYSYFEKLYSAFEDSIRLSFAAIPMEVVENVNDYMKDENGVPKCEIVYEKDNLKLLASSMLILHNNTATALYGADPIYEKLGQSYLLDFEEIRYALDNKCQYYDMGGVYFDTITDGLYSFKSRMTQNNLIKWLGVFEIILDKNIYQDYLNLKSTL